MASTKGQRKHRPQPKAVGPTQSASPAAPWIARSWAVPALFLALVLAFYAVPLFSSSASIQWDAADVHYTSQKYFSDNLLSGKLARWTPYVFSGMPFLADPQTGAWYPLNWPFFLAGVTPRSIEWELALHALLACVGTFLLVRDLMGSRSAAVLAGIVYGFSGFFAGHSSHVGIFQTAAVFPWLLWLAQRAASRDWRIYGLAAIAASGALVLIGHFQSALYSFAGVALFAAAMIILNEGRWRQRGPAILAAMAVGAVLLPAIMVLPGLELTAESIRSHADYSQQADATLTPGTLETLFAPDALGAISGSYKGPGDITQFYFYQGLLVPLLAVGGLWLRGRLRWLALAISVPALWYAFGPAGGLYALLARLPGFRSIRSPVHIWFVVALALALLAAAGAQAAFQRFNKPWLIPALCVVAFADVWHFNSNVNPLAYARSTFEELYGSRGSAFERACEGIRQNPLHRVWYERDSNSFGPMNSSLNTRTEVTYGYNPLELWRYASYRSAVTANPRLLDGLAVTHRIDPATGTIAPLASAMPRVSVPKSVVVVGSAEEARRGLEQLVPSERALVESAVTGITQDASAKASIANYTGDSYRVRYSAQSPTLLRIATPYFPGWTATVAGQPAPLMPVDLALIGVVVPAGSGEVVVSYRSGWFGAGALISGVAAALAFGGLIWALRSRQLRNGTARY